MQHTLRASLNYTFVHQLLYVVLTSFTATVTAVMLYIKQNSCGTCDMKDQCSPETPEHCCGHKIAAGISRSATGSIDSDVNVRCSSTKNAPCVMPPAQNDPCAENPCKNGASCGVQYISAPESCKREPVCECSSIPAGTFSGAFCEQKCKSGETACGGGVYEYDQRAGLPDKQCCAVGEDCLRVAAKYGYTSGKFLLQHLTIL
jgi:hypothetical protein